MIFFILILYITILAIAFNGMQNKKYSLFGFIVLSFLFIGALIAFRGIGVGADTKNYMRLYEGIGENTAPEIDDLEIGYVWFIKLLYRISKNPRTLFLFEALFVVIGYSSFILKNAKNISQAYIAVLAFLAFNLFSFALSGVRQTLAICICLFAYQYLKEQKFFKFLIVVFIGGLFHSSAWFFLPIYIINQLSSKQSRIVLIIFVIFAFFNFDRLFALVSTVDDRFEKYGVESTQNGFIFLAVMLVITTLAEIFRARLNKDDELRNIYAGNDACLSLWLLRLATRTAERPSFYYLPATMVLVSKFPDYFEDRAEKTIATVIISVCLIGLFFFRISSISYVFM